MDVVVPAPERPARFPALSLLAGLPCATVPFLLCWEGWGAYLRNGGFLAIPALIGTSFIVLYVFRALRNLADGNFRARQVRSPWDHLLILVFLGFSLLSWAAGVQARSWRCESWCKAVEPALEALRKYHAERGTYPTQLAQVPEVERIVKTQGLSLRAGRDPYGPWDVGFFRGPELIVYLWSDEYRLIVPLERPFIMSFTRFYILRRDAHSPKWTEDHVVWILEKINPRL